MSRGTWQIAAGYWLRAACVALLVSPHAAHAQDEAAAESSDAGNADVAINSRDWHAALSVQGVYTDNFFNQEDDSRRESVSGVTAEPQLSYYTDTRHVQLYLAGSGEYGTFDIPGDADDYLDGTGDVRLTLRSDIRTKLTLTGRYKHGHDPFGVDRTEAASVPATGLRTRELDEWDQALAGARFEYGAPSARIRAEIGGTLWSKDYTTNRAATEFLNADVSTVDYVLYYNFSAKTSALLDFSRTDIEFDRPNTCTNPALAPGDPGCVPLETRAGELFRVRAGMRWAATAKTSGDVRVGGRRRQFENSTDDVTGLDWQVGLNWSPVALTMITLRTARNDVESYKRDQTSTLDQRSAGLEWAQTWTSRVKTQVGADYARTTFVDGGREDEVWRGALGLDVLLSRTLTLRTSGSYQNRDSDVTGRDYDRIRASLGLRWAI